MLIGISLKKRGQNAERGASDDRVKSGRVLDVSGWAGDVRHDCDRGSTEIAKGTVMCIIQSN